MKILCAARGAKSGSEAAYGLLEYAYREQFGGDLPEIKKTPAGKPYFPLRPGLHFSISHSATHVLCALSNDLVGVDIESPRHISERTAAFFGSPDELLRFEPLDLWVLKESYIKLVGGTLVLVKRIRFSCEDGKIIAPDDQVFSKLYRIGECRAAVSARAGCLPDSVALI